MQNYVFLFQMAQKLTNNRIALATAENYKFWKTYGFFYATTTFPELIIITCNKQIYDS